MNKEQGIMINKCLNKETFEEVSKKIVMSHSIITLKIEGNTWEARAELDNGKIHRIVFSKDAWTVGGITSELKVYATAKKHTDNEASKEEIKKVFCTLSERLKQPGK